MKIYVASSWRNEFQPAVVEVLRSMGHEVYDFRNPEKGNHGFSWSQIDPNWENWTSEEYVKALEHPIAVEGFDFDFDAMKWADCCVMVLPCGRSANTEAGWMKGVGKSVYVFQPIEQEPELMYKIYDDIFVSVDELRKHFSSNINTIFAADTPAQRIEKLESAIDSTIAGLEWRADSQKETMDKSDYEHLDLLKSLVKS